MKLYDSRTNKKNQLSQKSVNIYSCGPTVYNHIHLGNARPVILMDVLTRYLTAEGYKPNWVQNITDIDDKIINKAGQMKSSETEISQKYLQSYLEDLQALNVKTPNSMPLISEHLPEMIDYIQKLIASGNAYESEGNVFFDVTKNQKYYGKLSKQKLNQLQPTPNSITKKKTPLDFTLWKKTDHGKNWSSPWGPGRPGWHTECVVLANSEFKGQGIDIHAGGIDLQFPHHENERAQHLALTGQELAKTWMHNGHLTFNSEKMSKSLGNTILVKDFLKQYEPDLLRWIFLTTNYRQPINFTDDLITQGEKFFKKLQHLRKKMIHHSQLRSGNVKVTAKPSAATLTKFRQAMNDNLNTAKVLSLLEGLITKTNQNLTKRQDQALQQNYSDLMHLLKTLGFRNHLGIELSKQDQKIYQRWLKAQAKQNFDEADKYRNQLQAKDLI